MSEEVKEVVEETVTEPASAGMEEVVHDENAPVITMRKLLEAGSHFGHQTRRWNPKMKKYIYGARNGVYIIDLAKTVDCISVAYFKMKEIVDAGGKVLFVGTKEQCRETIEQEALRSGSFYITNRWLGGTLTNFKTIQGRIRFLKELDRREEEGELDLLPKTEAAALRKEREKLTRNLNGIKEMRKIPNAIFVVDPRVEHNAVAEARKLNIPVFGIIDTNCDPDLVDYPIPANDDAIRSVALIVACIADAIVESKGGLPVVAFSKDEGEAITMKEVIKQTDRDNAEKLARIRAERAARQAQYQREQELRASSGDKAHAVVEEEAEIKKEKDEKEPEGKEPKAPKAPRKKPAEKKPAEKKPEEKPEEKKPSDKGEGEE